MVVRADELGDKPALVDGPSGRSVGYAALAAAARRAAAGFAAFGQLRDSRTRCLITIPPLLTRRQPQGSTPGTDLVVFGEATGATPFAELLDHCARQTGPRRRPPCGDRSADTRR